MTNLFEIMYNGFYHVFFAGFGCGDDILMSEFLEMVCSSLSDSKSRNILRNTVFYEEGVDLGWAEEKNATKEFTPLSFAVSPHKWGDSGAIPLAGRCPELVEGRKGDFGGDFFVDFEDLHPDMCLCESSREFISPYVAGEMEY